MFLDETPVAFDLFVTNFSEEQQPLTLTWTLTDFDGKRTTGTSVVTAQPLSRQTLSLTVDAPAPGHYHLTAEVRRGRELVDVLKAQLARIPSRDTKANRYSPIAMCAVGEFEVMKLAGVKSHRSDSASWARQVEPLDGVFYADHPQAPSLARRRRGPRAFRREGFLMLNGLNYARDGWRRLDRPADAFPLQLRSLRIDIAFSLDRFSGKGEASINSERAGQFLRPRGPLPRTFRADSKHV